MNDALITHMLRLAYYIACESPDPSSQVGAVVGRGDHVVSMACNNFIPGRQGRAEDTERPRKYALIEHAERGAVYKLIGRSETTDHRIGWFPEMEYNTLGFTMYAPWSSCADCARAIVLSGITTLVRHKAAMGDAERWNDSIALGDEIMAAGSVEVITWDGDIGHIEPILRDGKLWTPYPEEER